MSNARGAPADVYDAAMGENPGRKAYARHKPIYVEVAIRAPMGRVWQLSQDTSLHARWDLRFTRIIPTGVNHQGLLHFRYEFRLPFHVIHGTGTSLGHRHRSDGQATSVLKFDTADMLSPIGRGSGYWRYIPAEHGLRFITGYNYSPGMGAAGRLLDSWLFRPALGWATAISFDRLRLWAEVGLDPKVSRNRWFMDAAARVTATLMACLLLRRAVEAQSPGGGITAFAAALVPWLVPAHRTVPRAGRCLRRAPDERSGRAPSALAGLDAPASPGTGQAQGRR
ncbi:conserved hypothetical protein [Arthrobacter sp. 9AX]|nr:conserved hypothetical protein [Arthrobacter sp. 9AX]